jgi:hypothetical protein
MSGNEWFLKFKWKITFDNKYLNYVIFAFQVTKYIYNACFQVTSCSVLSVYQDTIYNIPSKYSPPEWVSRIDTSDHGVSQISKVPGFSHLFWEA